MQRCSIAWRLLRRLPSDELLHKQKVCGSEPSPRGCWLQTVWHSTNQGSGMSWSRFLRFCEMWSECCIEGDHAGALSAISWDLRARACITCEYLVRSTSSASFEQNIQSTTVSRMSSSFYSLTSSRCNVRPLCSHIRRRLRVYMMLARTSRKPTILDVVLPTLATGKTMAKVCLIVGGVTHILAIHSLSFILLRKPLLLAAFTRATPI